MRQYDPEERCAEVYRAIIAYKQEHDGCSPTLRELIERTRHTSVGYTSTSLIARALRKLEKKGLLRLQRRGKKGHVTGIEVVGAQWKPPPKARSEQGPQDMTVNVVWYEYEAEV